MVDAKKFTAVWIQLLLLLGVSWGVWPLPQLDPCVPNPCGENTLCLTQGNANAAAVSCECLPGYAQNDPSDPWKCVPVNLGAETANGGDNTGLLDISIRTSSGTSAGKNSEVKSESTTTTTTTTTSTRSDSSSSTETTTTTTTDRPSFLPPKEKVIGFNDDGQEVVFTAAVTTAPIGDGLFSRTFPSLNKAGDTNNHRLVGIDVDKVKSADCLVSDDCDKHEYCDVGVNKCKNACSLEVCGTGALCKGRLHRPLCYCPSGFEGNPNEECTKTPSREGTKFKRFVIDISTDEDGSGEYYDD